MNTLKTRVRGNLIGYLAVFLAMGGGAYAARAIPGADGTITGCFDKKGKEKGELRLIGRGKCAKREQKIVWNRRGSKGPQGDPGRPGPSGPRGPAGEPATKLFAFVSSLGNSMYGSGVVDTQRHATGNYTVTFDRTLDGCVALATHGTGSIGEQGSVSQAGSRVFVSMAADSPEVTVRTQAPDGASADRSFHIAMFC